VPAGLAATVLVGLFASQAYQAPDDRMTIDAPVPAREEAAMESANPPAPVAQADIALPAPAMDAQKAAAAAAPRAEPLARVAAPRALSRSDAAPQTAPAPPAAVPAPVVSAPVAETAPAAAAPQPVQSMPVSKARHPETSEYSMTAHDIAKPAPIPQVLMAPPADYRLSRELKDSENRSLGTPVSEQSPQRVTVTGSSIKREDPAAMVARVEALLKEGKVDEAKREWLKLRAQHPEHEAPAALETRMRDLLE
jgi:hypothetical protein